MRAAAKNGAVAGAVGGAVAGGVGALAKGTKGGPRAGEKFTPAGKRQVREANRAAHGGKLTCMVCERNDLVDPPQNRGGVPRLPNEGHVDHIIAMAKNGDGSPSNGRVLCESCNQAKGKK